MIQKDHIKEDSKSKIEVAVPTQMVNKKFQTHANFGQNLSLNDQLADNGYNHMISQNPNSS